MLKMFFLRSTFLASLFLSGNALHCSAAASEVILYPTFKEAIKATVENRDECNKIMCVARKIPGNYEAIQSMAFAAQEHNLIAQHALRSAQRKYRKMSGNERKAAVQVMEFYGLDPYEVRPLYSVKR